MDGQMMDLDNLDRITPLGDEYGEPYDEDEYGKSDTNILCLDENQEPGSEVQESGVDGDNFDDQGTNLSEDDNPEMVDGILDEDTVASGLSNLGRSADGTQQVYLHLTLPGYNMKDIGILTEYVHLQKIEIPYNDVADLSALGHMPYLLEIDASHNRISSLLDFNPPKNLCIVDLSFNNIEDMTDLSPHHCLTKLNLDNNHIHEIKGLEKCRRLSHLSLSHNKIERIQGLDRLPVRTLNLSGNKLKKIENLELLQYLQRIDFSGNKIRSMNGLQNHDFLETVDLEDNEIIDLSEVQYIKDLSLVREVNLQRNPIRELPDYRLSVLYHIQRLTELDRRRIDVDEKVSATNMFNPPLEVIAARDHIMHVVYSFLQPSRVLDSTLPSIETPYPMLVLVGPQGAGKKDLALKLVEEFPDYFGYGISHTTKKPHSEEVDGKDYHFTSIEDFEAIIKMGKFLQTNAYHGQLYGLTIDAVEQVAREGLACVVQMELEGVLTLKNTYFEPRYVLILPMDKDSHERRLRERNLYTEDEIKFTVDRAELYADYNREHPGFFDMMINSDDVTDAYKKLRRLVMDYLGISAQSPTQSELDPSNTGSNLLDREGTETLTQTSANLVRTWSKPSITDSISQALTNMKNKAQSPLPAAGRGFVEEESLRRRISAAKEAISGHMPTVYDVILRTPKTVPQPVTAQLGLGDEDQHPDRSLSAPVDGNNMDALPPSSPDSSASGSGSLSSLSNISEARDIAEQAASLDGSARGAELDLPGEAIDPLELMSGSASKNLSNPSVPLCPRPDETERNVLEFGTGAKIGSGQGSRPGTGDSRPGSGRPGSSRHPVLPPIGQSPKPEMLPAY